MNEIEFGTMIIGALSLLGIQSLAILAYLFGRRKLTSDRFKRFIGLLLIGVFSSAFPTGMLGVIFGFPAVLLSAILATAFLDTGGSK